MLNDIPEFALIISIRNTDQSQISSKMYKVEPKILHFNVYNHMKASQKFTLSEKLKGLRVMCVLNALLFTRT